MVKTLVAGSKLIAPEDAISFFQTASEEEAQAQGEQYQQLAIAALTTCCTCDNN